MKQRRQYKTYTRPKTFTPKIPRKGIVQWFVYDIFKSNPGISIKKARILLGQKLGKKINKSTFGAHILRLRTAGALDFYGKHVELGSNKAKAMKALYENKGTKTIAELAKELNVNASTLGGYSKNMHGYGIEVKATEPKLKLVPVLTPEQELLKRKAEKFVAGAVYKASHNHNFNLDSQNILKANVAHLLPAWIVNFSKIKNKVALSNYIYRCVEREAIDLIRNNLSVETGFPQNKIRAAGSLLNFFGLKMKDLPEVSLNDLDFEAAVRKIRGFKSYKTLTAKEAAELLAGLQLLQRQHISDRFERRE
jgi:hypothetical protein